MSEIKNYAGEHYGKHFTQDEIFTLFPNKDLVIKADDPDPVKYDGILYGVAEPGMGDKLMLQLTKALGIAPLDVVSHNCRVSVLGDKFSGLYPWDYN